MKDTSKLRLILICQLLVNESDAEHPLTIAKIRKILKDRYDLDTNRNTVTDDLRQLKAHGFPLEAWRSRQNRYYYNGRPFETAELKLLIDAVAASKFITERESQNLIGKITKLTTDAQAEQLKRHIYVDYYYTIGWLDPPEKITALPDADSASEGSLRTFRLDRIAAQPAILSEPAVPAPEGFDIAEWRRSVFRMYGTEDPIEVTLLCDNRVMRAIIDNFGIDAATQPVDENHFHVTVTVCPSPTFYRWLFGWGWDGSIVIEGPEEVSRQYKKMLRKALRKQSSAEKMSDTD